MPLKYTRITPSLPVTSVPASIDFYTTKLGFRLAGRDRDDHTWLQLVSPTETYGRYDAPVNIYLRRRGFPDVEDDKGPAKIYIRCDGEENDLKELFQSFVMEGVSVTAGISTKPWGLRDFTVEDLDGVSHSLVVLIVK